MKEKKKITDYLLSSEVEKLKKFSRGKKTPFLVIDLKRVASRYDELVKSMPFAKVHYAIKANPDNDVLKLLKKKGSNFDVASIYEIDQLLSLGISPNRISYGTTIKKEEDISYAFKKGIRVFASDSEGDLRKIAKSAPGSKVIFRIILEGGHADWPLSRKFGAHPDMIYHLIKLGKELGIDPYGISFHVGSQQRDIGQWDSAISMCKYLFDTLRQDGIELKAINLGGGFPADYINPTQNVSKYAKAITKFLKEDFPGGMPEILIEPGRSLVADAGVIVTEVVLISKKSEAHSHNWVYLDVGKFGGLMETLDESIKYPIFTEKQVKTKEKMEVILAGPTCDSYDILYEDFRYSLPGSLKDGDRLWFMTTGAYTQSYSAVGFNGFPPLKSYILK
jgi:ornithine decarboxylase